MQTLSNEDCQDKLKPKRLADSSICSYDQSEGDEHGGACEGDSGGPLAVRVNKRCVDSLQQSISSKCKKNK